MNPDTLNTINHRAALAASLIGNLFLCLCLYSKKHREIAAYRTVLTIQCAADIISGILYYSIGLHCTVVDGESIVLITGPWSYLDNVNIFGVPLKYYVFSAYPMATYVVILCVPLNFYFRYYLICR